MNTWRFQDLKRRLEVMRDNHIPAAELIVNHSFVDGNIIKTIREEYTNCHIDKVTEDQFKLLFSDGTFVWRAISHIEVLVR